MIALTSRMVAAEFLKLRRKRSLIAWSLLLSVGALVLYFVWAQLHHVAGTTPVGGEHGFKRGLEILGIFIGPLAAVLIGTEAGAGDHAAGVFRELVVTGRSRRLLFAVRAPGALALCLPVVTIAYLVLLAGTLGLAGSGPVPSLSALVEGYGWALLVDGAICVVAVGAAALTLSRPATVTALIGLEFVASPLLLQTASLGHLRDALLDASVLNLSPALSQGAPVIAESVTVTVAVLAAWVLAAVALGTWRTDRCIDGKMGDMDVPAPSRLMAAIGGLPAAAPLLARLDDQAGVYLVGGAVRDLLLGVQPLDLDLAVEGDPVALAERLGGEIRAHGRFGTCTATVGGVDYDFAQTRRERYPYPGSLPEVEPAALSEDLWRRDFTVDAMAVPLTGPDAGDLIAVPQALEDLDRRRLRVLHDRSFLDDPTRLLRLARYAARLEFAVAPDTRALAGAAVGSDALATVSGERIGTELRLAAREPDPVRALAALRVLGIDRAIHPDFGLDDSEFAHRALALLPDDGRRDRLVLAAAVRRLDAAAARALLDSLAFSAGDRDVIAQAGPGASALADGLQRAHSPSAIAEAAEGATPEAVALAGALGAEEAARAWLDRLRHVALSIRGDDLLAAGVAPGPAVGRALRAALAAKLDGRAPERAAELSAALAALGRDGGGAQ